MPAPKSTKPISPFPLNIDRNHFASWLSGFTDGEGCFHLSYYSQKRYPPLKHPYAVFTIGVRADDSKIIGHVQSYLQCGIVAVFTRPLSQYNSKPFVRFSVTCLADLWNIVIPHFNHFPLLAKKSRDFSIWKEGVRLAFLVSQRPRHGSLPKWAPAEREQFSELFDLLKKQRKYESALVQMPKSPPPEKTLFDGLP